MFTLALAQMAHPADGDVISAAEAYAEKAAEQGAQLLVFPECLMTPFEKTPEDFAGAAQPLEGPFVHALRSLAKNMKLWLVCTVNEESSPGGRPYNTAMVVDDEGGVAGCYRKTHLYRAHGLDEARKMTHGDELFTPIETPFCTLGLGICYDLRFPELARAAALAGCKLMIYPSAWVEGPHKLAHWNTLLAARAVENEMFVAGCCRPDRGCVGHSQVISPQGEVLAQAEDEAQLLFAEINLDQVTSTRDAMPIFQHRRPDLYQSLTEPLPL